MKKKYVLLLFFALFIRDGFADSLQEKSECRLSFAKDFQDEASRHTIKVQNSSIEATICIYGSTFFAPFSLVAIPTITNKTGKNVHVSYHSLFYGSDGTVLSTISQKSTLLPDTKHRQLGSSILGISKASFAAITHCEIVFHVWEPE